MTSEKKDLIGNFNYKFHLNQLIRELIISKLFFSYSRSRTNLTPLDDVERNSDIEDRKSDIEVHESPIEPDQNIMHSGIPPYSKSRIIKQAYVPSKLSELYKRRENGVQINKYQDERIRGVQREDFEDNPAPNKAIHEPIRLVRNEQARPAHQDLPRMAQKVAHPISNPHFIARNQNEVRPDPIDIDDGLEQITNDELARDPESLQRAFVSGMRKADTNQPMSLNRFRKEFRDDIAPVKQDSDDIDRLSDSNYSVVEQAYRDMDEFDMKVETYGRGKHYTEKVVDDRAFGEKSHKTINNIFQPQRMQKNKIRY